MTFTYKQKYFIIIIILICKMIFVQSAFPESLIRERLNKNDSLSIEYLDSMLNNTTKDKAMFYRFVQSYNGKKDFELSSSNSKLLYNESRPLGKDPLPLNGLYTWTSKYRKIKKELVFENGYIVSWKTFKKNKLVDFADYKRLYNNTPGTYYYEFFLFGSWTKNYYRNGSRGWDLYLIDQ